MDLSVARKALVGGCVPPIIGLFASSCDGRPYIAPGSGLAAARPNVRDDLGNNDDPSEAGAAPDGSAHAGCNTTDPCTDSGSSIDAEALIGDSDGMPRQPSPEEQFTDAPIQHVVLVSLDGLAPRFLEQAIAAGDAPTLERLQGEAAWTHNARTDVTHTLTLPNHTCMLTGLPTLPVPGHPEEQAHGYVSNTTPAPDATLHNSGNEALDYIPSVFDVAHDRARRTGLFASKPKFVIYDQSYSDAGAPDRIGLDQGNDKIDVTHIVSEISELTDVFIDEFDRDPPHFAFVHYSSPDLEGHSYGWGSAEYMGGLEAADTELGRIVDTIETDPTLDGHTALIVTSDHGGVDYGHGTATDPLVYEIPFYLWGPGIEPGDLYRLVEDTRTDPGDEAPSYLDGQPIRNGDAGNLALELLGLNSIPGSLMRGIQLALSP